LAPGQRMILKHSIVFGLSEYEIFWTLTHGGTLVLLPQGGAKDPDLMVRMALTHRPPIQLFVPAALRMFLDAAEQVDSVQFNLRVVLTCGEALPPELLHRLWSWCSGCHLDNHYGPTEGEQTLYQCRQMYGRQIDSIPLGRPLPGSSAFVLKDDMLCAVQEVGEICFGGPFIARGYLDPELTKASFSESEACGGRVYHTGDLAMWSSDGVLLSMGRRDHQVKLRGFRIELGEIEACLRKNGAKEAAVILQGSGASARLVGFATGDVDATMLESACRRQIPSYAVPRVIVLPELPRNGNGKLDRKSLPEAPKAVSEGQSIVHPQNAVEDAIRDVWAEVLGIDSTVISVHADFFAVGGSSAAAGQCVAKIRRLLQVELPIVEAYKLNTVCKLAEFVADNSKLASRASELQRHSPRERKWLGQEAMSFSAVLAQFMGTFFLANFGPTLYLVPQYGLATCIYVSYGSPKLIMALPVIHLAACFTSIIAVILLKILVVGELKPGRYPVWGWTYLRWWFGLALQGELDKSLSIFCNTWIKCWCLRLCGAKIESNVLLGYHFEIDSPDLISIGEGSMVQDDAKFGTAMFEDGMLVLGRIEVGARCILEHNAFLMPETSLPDGSMVSAGCTAASNNVSYAEAAAAGKQIKVTPAPVLPPTTFGQQILRVVIGVPIVSALHSLGFVPALLMLKLGSDMFSFFQKTEMIIAFAFLHHLISGPLVFLTVLILKTVIGSSAVIGSSELLPLMQQSTCFSRWLLARTIKSADFEHFMEMFSSTEMQAILYRCLGMKVGYRVHMDPIKTIDFEHIDIEDHHTTASAVKVVCASVNAAGPVRMLKQGVTADSTLVMPGVVVSERTIIGSKSVVPADTYLAPNTIVTGCVRGSPALLRSDAKMSAADQNDFDEAMTMLNDSVRFTAFNFGMILWAFTSAGLAEMISILPLTIFFYKDMSSSLRIACEYLAANYALDVCSVLFFAAMKWLLMGRVVAGNHIIFSSGHVRWLCMLRCKDQIDHILQYTRGSIFHVAIFRLLGARVGKNTVLLDVMQPDWDLYDIGDHCVDFGLYACHTFENMVLKLAPICVGNRCTIQDHGILMPGASMEDDAVLMPGSNVLKGEVVGSGQIWAGNPAGASFGLGA